MARMQRMKMAISVFIRHFPPCDREMVKPAEHIALRIERLMIRRGMV
jgi:hypothetical protein